MGLLLLFAMSPGQALARTVAAPDPTQGMLVIAGERPAGAPVVFPLSDTSVHAHIAGFVAQVKVRQTFNNPFTRHLEAVYVFPLPHNAAAQYSATTRISRSELKPGDLVFYRSNGHVGIYVGGGQIIDASRAGQPVKKRTIDIMTPNGYGRVT